MTNIYVILLVLKILGRFFSSPVFILVHSSRQKRDALSLTDFYDTFSAIRDHFRFYDIFLRDAFIRIENRFNVAF